MSSPAEIEIQDIDLLGNNVPKGKYPKITKRVGASPPQYPDIEDD
jgi:hypothetical protein